MVQIQASALHPVQLTSSELALLWKALCVNAGRGGAAVRDELSNAFGGVAPEKYLADHPGEDFQVFFSRTQLGCAVAALGTGRYSRWSASDIPDVKRLRANLTRERDRAGQNAATPRTPVRIGSEKTVETRSHSEDLLS